MENGLRKCVGTLQYSIYVAALY